MFEVAVTPFSSLTPDSGARVWYALSQLSNDLYTEGT